MKYKIKIKDEEGSNPTRRDFLKGVAATAVGLGSGYVGYQFYDKFIKDLLDSKMFGEHIAVTKVEQDMYFHNRGVSIKQTVPIPYVQFRDSVFQLYPITAEKKENASRLVERAHSTYNQGRLLKSHELQRAVDLFNFLHENPHTLDSVVENEIKLFQYESTRTPTIHPNQRYVVPVFGQYKSLEELISRRIDSRKTI